MRLLLYTSVIHNLLFGAEILNRWFEDLYIRWDIECNQLSMIPIMVVP